MNWLRSAKRSIDRSLADRVRGSIERRRKVRGSSLANGLVRIQTVADVRDPPASLPPRIPDLIIPDAMRIQGAFIYFPVCVRVFMYERATPS